jgi:hypothetical protein
MKVIATYESSENRADRLWGPPSLLTGFFPEVQQAGRDVGHLPPSSAELKDE